MVSNHCKKLKLVICGKNMPVQRKIKVKIQMSYVIYINISLEYRLVNRYGVCRLRMPSAREKKLACVAYKHHND